MTTDAEPQQKRKLGRIIGGIILLGILLIPIFTATGMQLENNDAFCTSCHTEPETTFYNRTQAATAVDLSSFHAGQETRCIDCHSGEGLNGRLHAMALGGGDAFKYIKGNYPQPAPLTQSIGDGNCLKCHQDVVTSNQQNSHYHVFLADWQKNDPAAASCVDCHQSHHTDGEERLVYLNKEHTVALCNQCHQFAGEGPTG